MSRPLAHRLTLLVCVAFTASACPTCAPVSPDGGPAPDGGIRGDDGGTDGGATIEGALTISPDTQAVFAGQLAWFRAVVETPLGARVDVTGDAVWSVDGEAGAIKAPGVIFSQGAGDVVVTATYGARSADAALTVNSPLDEVVALLIDPPALSLPMGFSAPLFAIAFYDTGTSLDVTGLATWEHAPAQAATLALGETAATLTAEASGDVVVTARFAGLTSTAQITIVDDTLLGIEVTPDPVFVPKGAEVSLSAVGRFDSGLLVDVTDAVSWSSDDPLVASFAGGDSAPGVLSGNQAGSAQITAASGAVQRTVEVTVTPAAPVALDVLPAVASIPAGGARPFVATALLTDGLTLDVTADAEFVIEDASTAFLERRGDAVLVHGVVPGQTVLGVSYAGLLTKVDINVTAAEIVLAELLPADLSLPNGVRQQYFFFATFSDGTRLDLSASANFGTSAPEVAYFTGAVPGQLHALAPGQAVLSASFAGQSATTTMTVTEAELVGIQVFPPSLTAPVGEQNAFTAIGVYSDDTQRNITAEVTWSVLDSAIATVSNAIDNQGVASGVAPGSTEVVATAFVDDAPLSDSAVFDVTDADVQSIVVTPIAVVVRPGFTEQARAFAQYSDGVTQEVTEQATWTAERPEIASVSNAASAPGLVTGLVPGNTTIEAFFGGAVGQRHVIVPEDDFDVADIFPEDVFLTPGSSAQFSFIASYAEYQFYFKDLTQDAIWASSDESIAVVDNFPFGAGRVTGVSPGIVTISATVGGLSASNTISVEEATLTGLVLAPTNLVLPVDAVQPVVALGTFDDGTVVDLTADASFVSSDATVVTLLDFFNGYMVALSPGQATVTATVGALSADILVDVIDAQPTAVVLTPVNPILDTGRLRQFYATGLYDDGTTGDLSFFCTWTSSDPQTLLVVNEPYAKGLAYGLEPGVVTVSAQCGALLDSTEATVK